MSFEALLRMFLNSLIGSIIFLFFLWVVAIVLCKKTADDYPDVKNWVKPIATVITILVVIFFVINIINVVSVNSLPRSTIDRSVIEEQTDEFKNRNQK